MKPKRIDQILSNYGYCSRREASYWIRCRRITTTTGQLITSPSQKMDPCEVLIEGQPIEHPDGLLIALHKPVGYVCSHSDQEGPTVFDGLPIQWLQRKPKPSLVGRLDKETSGLLIITDDGSLLHHLTSPRHRMPKCYQVQVDQPLDPELVSIFARGDLVLSDEAKPCLPAELTLLTDQVAQLTLYEGRFHQVRRMFRHFGYTVESLHRFQYGCLTLATLEPGAYRNILRSEIDPNL